MNLLEGNKIILRSISLNDVTDEYVSWLNDKEIIRGLESPPQPYTSEMLEKYIAEMISGKDIYMFAIIEKNTQQHIGNIKLHNFKRDNSTCELGLLIGNKNCWGKGYGQEACKLAIHFAFEQLKMRKVWLAVHANNPGAIALYNKLGFKMEGQLKEHILSDGKYIDKFLMGVFAKNFQP